VIFPIIGTESNLPKLEYVRDLEDFQGPLLSEWIGKDGESYIEKWCSCDLTCEPTITRTLFVRSEKKSIKEYLDGLLTMHELLSKHSSNEGLLCDYGAILEEKVPSGELYMRSRITKVKLDELPEKYLPSPKTYHDPLLRPFDFDQTK